MPRVQRHPPRRRSTGARADASTSTRSRWSRPRGSLRSCRCCRARTTHTDGRRSHRGTGSTQCRRFHWNSGTSRGYATCQQLALPDRVDGGPPRKPRCDQPASGRVPPFGEHRRDRRERRGPARTRRFAIRLRPCPSAHLRITNVDGYCGRPGQAPSAVGRHLAPATVSQRSSWIP